ncbi:MAG TPA: DUF1579 family protein [Terracidiphilus sp.]|nr:DUF1579 family protein [Terracidiphilus sp.]
MNTIYKVAKLSLAIWIAAVPVAGWGQNGNVKTVGVGFAQSLLQSMVGDWSVSQRMWSATGAQPIELPRALAHRRLLQGAVLQEEMTVAPGEKAEAFTRMAYFDYNPVASQYEYFSIDSRAPQMMNERGYSEINKTGEALSLSGGIFVAPKWGNVANAAFRYRLVIGLVQQNRQIVQLYLTPLSGEPGKEFLAFEYVYTEHP